MNYGGKRVLNGVDLEVFAGQIIGYIGPNGAGKSTTVKIMLGLVHGYQGEVVFLVKISRRVNSAQQRKIGYVPENAEAYDNLTASEYLIFTGELYGMERKHAEEKAVRLLKEFELGDSNT